MNELAIPDTSALEAEGVELVKQARAFVVHTADDARLVDAHRAGCKALEKAICALLDPMAEAAHAAHKAITSRRAALVKAPREAADIDGRALAKWYAEEEAAKRALEAEANAAAEAERARLLAESEKAAQAGDFSTAKALVLATTEVKMETVETTRLENTAFRDEWLYEVTDFDALPRGYKTVDHAALRASVKALKGSANIPGVRVWVEKVPVSKGGAK